MFKFEKCNSLRGHLGNVYDLAVSNCSKYLITASTDKTVMLWDFEKGVSIRIFSGHQSLVQSVEFMPCGNAFASIGLDRQLKIYNKINSNNTHSQTFKTHSFILQDNKENCSRRATLNIMGTAYSHFFRRISFSPCGKLLFVPSCVMEVEKSNPMCVTLVFSTEDISKYFSEIFL